MKKVLAFAMALVILACCSLAVAEGRVKTPAGQIEGQKLYFIIESAFFKADSDIIIIGQKDNEYYKRYDQPVNVAKVDDDLLVPVDAMSKIFQFTYEYDAATGAIHLEDEFVKADLAIGSKDVTINGAADTLGAAPAEVDGVLCVPAVSVGTKVFELVTGESLGYTYLSYVETALPEGSTGTSGKITQLTMPGKIFGVIEPVYWFEDAQMLMPYRVTIPTSYDPEVPNALVVFLHGASGNDNRDVERATVYGGESGYLWDFIMDRYGFIGLSVNGYNSQQYGAKVNDKDPNVAAASALCEKEVLAAIEQVKAKYNIDDDRVFLMGNSMGSLGTLTIAFNHPEMFAGISPSPSFNPAKDASVLGDMAIRVVACTEDKNYNTAYANYLKYKEQGANITFRGVCGGAHNIGWSEVLDETIAFFASVK